MDTFFTDVFSIDTFKVYTQNKLQIHLDLHDLYELKGDIFIDKIMNDITPFECIEPFDRKNRSNLFKGDNIFRLFHNLQTIVIMTTDVNGSTFYSFSFSYLLSMISRSSTIKKVVINAMGKGRYNCLNNIWLSYNKRLKKLYKSKDFDIYKEVHKDNVSGDREYSIIIQRT